MKSSNFILGVALLLVAATLAISITFRNDPAPAAEARQEITSYRSGKPSKVRSFEGSGSWSGSRSPSTADRVSEEEAFEITIAGNLATPSPQSLAELNRKAELVSQEAREKLDLMTERFHLTRAQRREIFPLLARGSASYDPAMVVGSGPVSSFNQVGALATSDELIHDALDPSQQEAFEQDAIDKELWWEEIASQLADDEIYAASQGQVPASDVPGSDSDAPTESQPESQPEGPALEQGGNIFDLLNQK